MELQEDHLTILLVPCNFLLIQLQVLQNLMRSAISQILLRKQLFLLGVIFVFGDGACI